MAAVLITRVVQLLCKGGLLQELASDIAPPRRVSFNDNQIRVEELDASTFHRFRLAPRYLRDLGGAQNDLPEDTSVNERR